MVSATDNKLLKAFGSHVDDGTISFLLEALTHAETEDWEHILEPFVDEPSAIINVLLASATNDTASSDITAESHVTAAITIIEEARKVIDQSSSQQEDGNEAEATSLSSNPLYQKVKYTPIPGAQNRAISLRQLRQVIEYIESKVIPAGDERGGSGILPWIDTDEQSPSYGQRLHLSTINFYQVLEWVIKPLTQEHECSLIEIIATEPQKPKWVRASVRDV